MGTCMGYSVNEAPLSAGAILGSFEEVSNDPSIPRLVPRSMITSDKPVDAWQRPIKYQCCPGVDG